jgi:hypothetical protein
MIQEKAQAITSSHCMGDPRGCLSFSKLNDFDFVGGYTSQPRRYSRRT